MKYYDLIKELYMIEDQIEHKETVTKTISVKMQIEHEAMLRCICDRFNKPLSGFAGEILENAVTEMYTALNQDDRIKLSKDADKSISNAQKEKGLKITVKDSNGNEIEAETDFWTFLALASDTEKTGGDK